MRRKLERQLKKTNKNILVFLVIFFMLLSAGFAYLWLTEYPSPLHKDDETSNSNNGDVINDDTLVKNNDGTYSKILSETECSNVEVYYIDLKGNDGETKIGDSTYIKCNNVDIVIDAGIKNVGSTTVVPFLKEKVTDKVIDLVIITHTDNDHIGGFVGLSSQEGVLSIEGFTYKYILESGYSANTDVYQNLMNLVNSSNAKVCNGSDSLTGANGCAKTFKMGNITLDVLDTGFYNDNTASANDRSIVTLLTHGEITYLFPGDLEEDATFASTASQVDIFKAAHHGANSANSSTLLNALSPEVIILSAGLDGVEKYDIPQQESLDRMYAIPNVKVYATFTTGTIKITSNGTDYNISADNLIQFEETDWFKENRTLNTN